MNHKQKLGYMTLGAGILGLGIIIGQFVTPGIEAQNNGVFEKITCGEIEVVDSRSGKRRVLITKNDYGGSIGLYNNVEEVQAGIGVGEYGGAFSVLGRAGGFVSIRTDEDGGAVNVYANTGRGRASMGIIDGAGIVTVLDNKEIPRASMMIFHGNGVVSTVDKTDKFTTLGD